MVETDGFRRRLLGTTAKCVQLHNSEREAFARPISLIPPGSDCSPIGHRRRDNSPARRSHRETRCDVPIGVLPQPRRQVSTSFCQTALVWRLAALMEAQSRRNRRRNG